MQQKQATGNKPRGYYSEKPKCHFCKLVCVRGEEILIMGAGYGRDMHRDCLEAWLDDHPPLDGAVPARKMQSVQDTEKEFEKLRRLLAKQVGGKLVRTAKTPVKQMPRPVVKVAATKAVTKKRPAQKARP